MTEIAMRNVVCENCGEIIEIEGINTYPELEDADRLVPAEECSLCADEDDD